MQTDDELVLRALKGDDEALRLLVERYLKQVYRFVFHYLPSSEDAEDVTQEVFVKVWKHLRKFHRDQNFKTWVFTIAKNTALDFLKQTIAR